MALRGLFCWLFSDRRATRRRASRAGGRQRWSRTALLPHRSRAAKARDSGGDSGRWMISGRPAVAVGGSPPGMSPIESVCAGWGRRGKRRTGAASNRHSDGGAAGGGGWAGRRAPPVGDTFGQRGERQCRRKSVGRRSHTGGPAAFRRQRGAHAGDCAASRQETRPPFSQPPPPAATNGHAAGAAPRRSLARS